MNRRGHALAAGGTPPQVAGRSLTPRSTKTDIFRHFRPALGEQNRPNKLASAQTSCELVGCLAIGDGTHFHDFEITSLDFANGGQFVMNPPIIGGSTDEPVTAVVG
jgi:hypothetical protein